MRKIAENIYEHNGIKVESVEINQYGACRECPFYDECCIDFICSRVIGNYREFVPYIENKGE